MHLESRSLEHRLRRIKRRANAGSAARSRASYRPPLKASAPPSSNPEAELATAAASAGHALEGCRRRSPRMPASGEVSVRRIGSFNFQATLQDVSAGGCRVELIEAYEIGDRVIARFEDLEPFGARVRWSAGTTGGIEFLTTMHPAVFDRLLARLTR
jgi:hypothetical protein